MSILKGASGYSLVEVLIAAGVMMGVGLGVATMVGNQSNQIKSQRNYMSRDALKAALDYNVRSYEALKASARRNAAGNMLYNCVFEENPAIDTTPCTGGTQDDLMLYPANPEGASGSPLPAIAGSVNQNRWVYYQPNGEPCVGATAFSRRCPLAAWAKFSWACDGGDPCKRAATVTVQYTIERAPIDSNIPASVMPAMAKIEGSNTFQMDAFLAMDMACKAGEVVFGITAEGGVDCVSEEFAAQVVTAPPAPAAAPTPRRLTDVMCDIHPDFCEDQKLAGGPHTYKQCRETWWNGSAAQISPTRPAGFEETHRGEIVVDRFNDPSGKTRFCRFRNLSAAPKFHMEPHDKKLTAGGHHDWAAWDINTSKNGMCPPALPDSPAWSPYKDLATQYTKTNNVRCMGGTAGFKSPSGGVLGNLAEWFVDGLFEIITLSISSEVLGDIDPGSGPTYESGFHFWSPLGREAPKNVRRYTGFGIAYTGGTLSSTGSAEICWSELVQVGCK